MPKPMLMLQAHFRIAHPAHRRTQLVQRVLRAQDMRAGHPDADFVDFGEHSVGAVVVVVALDTACDVLLVDLLVREAHHRRDELAVFPVRVALVREPV